MTPSKSDHFQCMCLCTVPNHLLVFVASLAIVGMEMVSTVCDKKKMTCKSQDCWPKDRTVIDETKKDSKNKMEEKLNAFKLVVNVIYQIDLSRKMLAFYW